MPRISCSSLPMLPQVSALSLSSSLMPSLSWLHNARSLTPSCRVVSMDMPELSTDSSRFSRLAASQSFFSEMASIWLMILLHYFIFSQLMSESSQIPLSCSSISLSCYSSYASIQWISCDRVNYLRCYFLMLRDSLASLAFSSQFFSVICWVLILLLLLAFSPLLLARTSVYFLGVLSRFLSLFLCALGYALPLYSFSQSSISLSMPSSLIRISLYLSWDFTFLICLSLAVTLVFLVILLIGSTLSEFWESKI